MGLDRIRILLEDLIPGLKFLSSSPFYLQFWELGFGIWDSVFQFIGGILRFLFFLIIVWELEGIFRIPVTYVSSEVGLGESVGLYI